MTHEGMTIMKCFLLIAAIYSFSAVFNYADAQQDDPIMERYEAGYGPSARDAWELAASTGDYDAQVKLGWLYSGAMDPKGVEINLEKARYWMAQAVKQRDIAVEDGLDIALYKYADALHDGKMESVVGKADANEVIEWLALAADLGHAGAGVSIGTLYQSGGDGLAPDLTRAEKWFEWAAPASALGLLQAAAIHYQQGHTNRAFYWLDQAWRVNALGIENVYGRDPVADQGGFATFTSTMRKRVAATLFPQPLKGWEAGGFAHKIISQTEGDAVVTRNGDEIRYPIEMMAAYADPATGASVVLTIRLNDMSDAKMIRAVAQAYEQYDDKKRRKLQASGADVADVNGHRAFSSPGANIVYRTALANDVLVSTKIIKSSGDEQTDRKIATDYLRAFDFQKIIEGTRGHGVFTVSDDGTIVKP